MRRETGPPLVCEPPTWLLRTGLLHTRLSQARRTS